MAPLQLDNKNKGFVTLLATLIVSAFGIALASSLLYQSGNSAISTAVLERSFEARAYTDACAEQALFNIEQSELYTGSGTLEFEQGSCEFEVSADEGESIVESSGFADTAVRKVRVIATTELVVSELSTTTLITGVEWSEPADF